MEGGLGKGVGEGGRVGRGVGEGGWGRGVEEGGWGRGLGKGVGEGLFMLQNPLICGFLQVPATPVVFGGLLRPPQA